MIELINNNWGCGLVILFVIYQVFDHYSFLHLLNKTGKTYCEKNNFQFVEIKHASAHFSVVYKSAGSGRRQYKKFKFNAFLGKVTLLEWLD